MPLKIIVLLILVLYMIFFCIQSCYLSIIAFQYLDGMNWIVFKHDGTSIAGVLMQDTIVTPYFVLLRFRCSNQTHSCLVMQGILEKNAYKRLQLQLKSADF